MNKTTQFTIGQLLGADDEHHRDAVHIAVVPVVANQTLSRGDHIGLVVEGSLDFVGKVPVAKAIGIVDPFLKTPVAKGERFWMFMNANTVNSLRHAWDHPAFPSRQAQDFSNLVEHGTTQSASRKWLDHYADELGMTYKKLVERTNGWLEHGDYITLDFDTPSIVHESGDDFWKHWEVVHGRKVPDEKKERFVGCAC